MRITIATSSLTRRAGGIFEIERELALGVAQCRPYDVAVVGLSDEYVPADVAAWLPLQPIALPVVGPRALGYSPRFTGTIRASCPDLVHLHGLWMYPSAAVTSWAATSGRPYIKTIHGMLDQWALRHSALKKRSAAAVFESRALREAACLHVNSEAELEQVRRYGLRNPVGVIPNGDKLVPHSRGARASTRKDRKTLLYIGRLHPKKGLPALLDAWRDAWRTSPELRCWTLAIAGWDENGHAGELADRVHALGVRDSVSFLGPTFGAEKTELLVGADAFVLPSLSEGFPIAVLEAWSFGLPVLMTPQCNIPLGFDAGAAVRMTPDPASIRDALLQMGVMTDAERRTMGDCGRTLVERRFLWSTAAAEMARVYDWLLAAGPRPASVSLA